MTEAQKVRFKEMDAIKTEMESYEYIHGKIEPEEDENAEVYFDETCFDEEVKKLQGEVFKYLKVLLKRREFLSIDDFVMSNWNWFFARASRVLPKGSPEEMKSAIISAWYTEYAREIDNILLVRAIHAA